MTDLATAPSLPATTGIRTPSCSTSGSVLGMLNGLPTRLDDPILAIVRDIASMSLPSLEIADDRFVAICMKTLDANLPRKATDVDSARMRLQTQERAFAGVPRQALSWATEQAVRTCKWVPTIAELLALVNQWKRDDESLRARTRARAMVSHELQQRLNEARTWLKFARCAQLWIDGLSEHDRKVLAGERLLYRCPDCGSYAQRGQWRHWAEFQAEAA